MRIKNKISKKSKLKRKQLKLKEIYQENSDKNLKIKGATINWLEVQIHISLIASQLLQKSSFENIS